jgi:hypothetical protein
VQAKEEVRRGQGGRRIVNPRTGQRMVFFETGEETEAGAPTE